MTNAEAGSNRTSGEQDANPWDSLRHPEAENTQEREPILQRIKRIIASKAEDIMNRREKRKMAQSANERFDQRQADDLLEYQLLHADWDPTARADAMASLPEEAQERVDFIDRNLDLYQVCPSTGNALSQRDAKILYHDYLEHVDQMNEDDVPHSKLGILLEMENMLEEQIEITKQMGDRQAQANAERRYNMILDLESIAATPEYYNYAENMGYVGSQVMMRKYIRDKLKTEGYNGTANMREAKPRIVGGALSLERTFGVINELNSDAPIKDIWDSINSKKSLGRIDWTAIERFSPRGQELRTYYDSLRVVSDKKELFDEYSTNSKECTHIAELLKSDTPTEELPEDIQSIVENEKYDQLSDRYFKAAETARSKAELYRGDATLSEDAQSELSKSGFTRMAYANYLEKQAKEFYEKGRTINDRELTDELRAEVDAYDVSRDDLADRYEKRAESYNKTASIMQGDLAEFQKMLERSEDEFLHDILLEGQDGIPSYPQEVASYLCRTYRYSGEANTIGARFFFKGGQDNPRTRLEGIRAMVRDVKGQIATQQKLISYMEHRFGEPAFDVEDTVMEEAYRGGNDSIAEYAKPVFEASATQAYADKVRFLEQEVLTALSAAEDALVKQITPPEKAVGSVDEREALDKAA